MDKINSVQLEHWNGGKKISAINERIRFYSKILQKGDFTRWIKFCFMDKNKLEYKRARLNALWIYQRFTDYKSVEWKRINGMIYKEYQELKNAL